MTIKRLEKLENALKPKEKNYNEKEVNEYLEKSNDWFFKIFITTENLDDIERRILKLMLERSGIDSIKKSIQIAVEKLSYYTGKIYLHDDLINEATNEFRKST